MSGTILIYGATGYTGKLIAKVAADQGAWPILAGRNLEKVQAIAKPLEFASRAFDLRDRGRIDSAIKDVSVVLCVAGPFSATSKPMSNACLRNRIHYLDITGEIDVFEALAARDAEAKAQGGTIWLATTRTTRLRPGEHEQPELVSALARGNGRPHRESAAGRRPRARDRSCGFLTGEGHLARRPCRQAAEGSPYGARAGLVVAVFWNDILVDSARISARFVTRELPSEVELIEREALIAPREYSDVPRKPLVCAWDDA